MRKTKKYMAAVSTANKHKMKISWQSNGELYQHLEDKRWWWDASVGVWKKSAKPSTSMFATDEGEATGVIRLRVMAHSDDIEDAVNRIKKLDGLRVTDVSEPYDNRKGQGVRVYITGILI